MHWVGNEHSCDRTGNPQSNFLDKPAQICLNCGEEDQTHSGKATDHDLGCGHWERKNQHIDQNEGGAHLGRTKHDKAKTEIGDRREGNSLSDRLIQSILRDCNHSKPFKDTGYNKECAQFCLLVYVGNANNVWQGDGSNAHPNQNGKYNTSEWERTGREVFWCDWLRGSAILDVKILLPSQTTTHFFVFNLDLR